MVHTVWWNTWKAKSVFSLNLAGPSSSRRDPENLDSIFFCHW